MCKFISCEGDNGAKTVIFGAPFDGTTSYRPGTRFAPAKIRAESYGIETYSPYQEKDLEDYDIHDSLDLDLPFGNTERVLHMIYERSKELHDSDKLPVMLGGEHLVTLPAVRAAFEKYPDLALIQFDAHTDLRDSYLGERLSHSAVIRRCHEFMGDGSIYQFGIRSGERAEFDFAKAHTFLTKHNADGIGDIIPTDKPIYLTIDLDVLDPSEFPGTGTPEAGGMRFLELMEALMCINFKNVVALDINELSPPYDPSGISTALACKLLRELLLMLQ